MGPCQLRATASPAPPPLFTPESAFRTRGTGSPFASPDSGHSPAPWLLSNGPSARIWRILFRPPRPLSRPYRPGLPHDPGSGSDKLQLHDFVGWISGDSYDSESASAFSNIYASAECSPHPTYTNTPHHASATRFGPDDFTGLEPFLTLDRHCAEDVDGCG